MKIVKFLLLSIFTLISFSTGSHAILEYKQLECKHNVHSDLSIKLGNIVTKKGVDFGDTGVKFLSKRDRMTYARGYEDISKVVFVKTKNNGPGYLSVEFTNEYKGQIDKVGFIEPSCWSDIKRTLANFPNASNVSVAEK